MIITTTPRYGRDGLTSLPFTPIPPTPCMNIEQREREPHESSCDDRTWPDKLRAEQNRSRRTWSTVTGPVVGSRTGSEQRGSAYRHHTVASHFPIVAAAAWTPVGDADAT
ncbi:hypothetical protein CSUB01_10588 [Colletotrichum sublineola]|uniref:Uncharacterized protein n=1 Tax=Colletotrichum sublineola TaxID=1173701 RepID=A0A066XIK3_COLSU|nr:hypothetical protein CSUB01_10588 [Colletotrichum sublineola]